MGAINIEIKFVGPENLFSPSAIALRRSGAVVSMIFSLSKAERVGVDSEQL